MGVDIDIKTSKERSDDTIKEEKIMNTDEREEKQEERNQQQKKPSERMSKSEFAFAIFGGIGGFAIAKGVAKALVKTKNPIVALGVGAVELTAAAYAFDKSGRIALATGDAIRHTLDKHKNDDNDDNEGYNDHVTFH